jgi:hypothetical protein
MLGYILKSGIKFMVFAVILILNDIDYEILVLYAYYVNYKLLGTKKRRE